MFQEAIILCLMDRVPRELMRKCCVPVIRLILRQIDLVHACVGIVADHGVRSEYLSLIAINDSECKHQDAHKIV